MTPVARPYHHGNLRRVLLDTALDVIAERGAQGLSLRDLAAKAGVSHAAPAHHFGDKAGLLTAIAAEGYQLLADALETASSQGGFLDVGLAYVAFAVGHPAHFQVMYEPSWYRRDDPAVVAATDRTAAVLYGRAAEVGGSGRSAADVGLAGWCLMHGFATLWLTGNLPDSGEGATDVARRIATTAFRAPDERAERARELP